MFLFAAELSFVNYRQHLVNFTLLEIQTLEFLIQALKFLRWQSLYLILVWWIPHIYGLQSYRTGAAFQTERGFSAAGRPPKIFHRQFFLSWWKISDRLPVAKERFELSLLILGLWCWRAEPISREGREGTGTCPHQSSGNHHPGRRQRSFKKALLHYLSIELLSTHMSYAVNINILM